MSQIGLGSAEMNDSKLPEEKGKKGCLRSDHASKVNENGPVSTSPIRKTATVDVRHIPQAPNSA